MTKTPGFSFRRAQAAYDLIGVARAAGPEAVGDLAALCGAPHSHLQTLIQESACRFLTDQDRALYDGLSLAAVTPTSQTAFAVATAILLADLLQDGFAPDPLDWQLEAHLTDYLTLEPVTRAAILNGYDAAIANDLTPDSDALRNVPADQRLSRSMDDVASALLDVARSMPDNVRQEVAHADYGTDVQRHLAALNAVLQRPDGRFSEDEYWYPSEVVELVAYDPAAPGFVPCTALLLANALNGNDTRDWFQSRWPDNSIAYHDLPGDLRDTIMGGLRALYQSGSESMSDSDDFGFDPVLTPKRLIPAIGLGPQNPTVIHL